MQLTAHIVLLCAAALCYAVQAVYFTHMFQLNSYRPERYRTWMNDHPDRIWNVRRMLPVLCVVAALLPLAEWIRCWIGAGVLLVAALLNLPPKAKKPLVVTARVKRLFAVEGLVLALILAASWILGVWRGLFWLGLCDAVVWLWVRVAGALAAPLEKRIANRYVEDARRRLAAHSEMTVIGITGSYGKTSTKNFLHALLSAKYNVLMTPENYNTTMGVVRTIRERLQPSHQIFLAEMGAKNVGDIREICGLVHPTMGIITSIGEQHLETFGSIDNIIRTKFELADALPADGTIFVNEDNEHIHTREVACRRVGYGLQAGDYIATELTVDGSGSAFTVTAPDGSSRRFSTKLLGAHNIQNLVGCIAVAHTMGISLDDLAYPVRLLKPVEHRLQLLPNGFIDDAYNSNPAGFRAALDVLAGFAGRRVLVTPGMVELGERQEALNREAGAYAATRCDYAILVGERQAPPLLAGLQDGGFDESHIFVAKTLQEGLAHLRTLPADPAQIVLLENDLPDNF